MSKQKTPSLRICDWRDDDDGIWHTSCGHAFVFETGTPAENHAVYCQHCGGRLRELRRQREKSA